MALWQYTFRVLPKGNIGDTEGYSSKNMEDGFDDEFYWTQFTFHRRHFYEIESILRKTNSWSGEIDLYGNQESNCLEVVFDANFTVLSASFRVDFTTNYERLLRHMIDFFLLKGFIILDERLGVIALNYEQVRYVITNSPQASRYYELLKKGKNKQ